MLVGVLSDTHGLLRPEAISALAGVDHLLHAGDIGNPPVGDPQLLDELRRIAPVTAIRGNIDRSGPCARLPATEAVELDGLLVYMLHSLDDLDLHPRAAGISLVVSGHSHRPSVEQRDGVVYLNPGSAGPRRFSLPVTVALVTLNQGKVGAEIVSLAG
jgi:putative phosphoesterase